MATLLSPQVFVKETDLTTVVPALSTSSAALAGQFNWGPVNQPVWISSENELIERYGKPDNDNANDWWTTANFLAYSNSIAVVRVVDETNVVTTLRAKNASASGTGYLVRNENEYENLFKNGALQETYSTGPWIARFPGDLGNSIGVSVVASDKAFENTLTGTVAVAAKSKTVTGTGTNFDDEIKAGDSLVIANEVHKVRSVTSDTAIELETRHNKGATAGATAKRRWEFSKIVDNTPGTSTKAANLGGSGDEMHVVIFDALGYWTGVKNSVLEVYQFVSQASDATLDDGRTNFYKDVINKASKYVYWAGHEDDLVDAGKKSLTDFTSYDLPLRYVLTGGSDGENIDEEQKVLGYNLFQSKEDIDVSFILGAAASQTLAVHIINNITEARKDCVAFFSPPLEAVLNNIGDEADDVVAFRNSLPSTSYATLDGNWKYQYDVYNDVYRYVPLNGDIAGLFARTDQDRDAWWAAAGLNRGHIKNTIKLAWNPKLADRDILYKNGINPVVSFTGEGPVLWGNKTLLAKPSAFDRMNVRRLFITLEKNIERASRYSLFEFNDEFTRAQFRNLVEPFLRDVKGRRGIYEFQVVCDETNNTPTVIDRNEFRGDIYIKPARTAEYITLNFVATPTGVEFSEVVGRSG